MSNEDSWYDLQFDRDLIEASFAMQYGVRLRNEKEISWAEFYRLLKGIMPETPLGVIVSIRSEKDFEKIKAFSKYEKDIYNKWRQFRARDSKDIGSNCSSQDWEKQMSLLQKRLESSFG